MDRPLSVRDDRGQGIPAGGDPGEGLQVAIRRRLGAFRLDVTFEAAVQGVTVLFGPSGGGKTQTLAAIAGAERPDAGRIALAGRTLFDSEHGVDMPMQRRAVGWVFQDARLFPHLSVAANLRYGARRARGRRQVAAFPEVVEVLGIGHLLARAPRDLSGGERQRVAIGRALLSQPTLLLMDEPLSALDPARRAEVLPYLEGLKARFRLPILYVTHALSEVYRLADRLVLIEAGRATAQGPVAELSSHPAVTAIAGRRGAASLLETVVEGHEPARGLTRLRAGALALRVPSLSAPPGTAVRVAVLARDVLLALEPPRAISARNLAAGRIEALDATPDGDVRVRVRLAAGPAVLSLVTRDAAMELGLEPGLQVWAILKSVAVEDGRPGGLLQALDL